MTMLASIASVTAQVAPGFDPVAATDAYLASVDAAARARSDAYFEGTYWLILWNALVGIVIAGALLQAASCRDCRRRPIGGRGNARRRGRPTAGRGWR